MVEKSSHSKEKKKHMNEWVEQGLVCTYSSFQVEMHVAAVRHEGFQRQKTQRIQAGPYKPLVCPLRTRPAMITFLYYYPFSEPNEAFAEKIISECNKRPNAQDTYPDTS